MQEVTVTASAGQRKQSGEAPREGKGKSRDCPWDRLAQKVLKNYMEQLEQERVHIGTVSGVKLVRPLTREEKTERLKRVECGMTVGQVAMGVLASALSLVIAHVIYG